MKHLTDQEKLARWADILSKYGVKIDIEFIEEEDYEDDE